MDNKQVHVIGGGTVSHLRAHLGLRFPDLGSQAYGATAERIATLCQEHDQTMDVNLHLTRMVDHTSKLETNADMTTLVRTLVDDPRTKIIFFNPAICDFDGEVQEVTSWWKKLYAAWKMVCSFKIPTRQRVASGKTAERLRTSDDSGNPRRYTITLTPAPKIIRYIRKEGFGGKAPRKDIMLIGFKATAGKSGEEQYKEGLKLLKTSSANLVLANDIVTHRNMIIVPEEGVYHETFDREEALRNLVEMAYLRSHLTFTRSTVKDGQPIPWESELVPESLRVVVNYCIQRGAYKKFLGVTAGHFAVKINDTTFLSSRRKTNFNEMKNVGLVKIETDGPDSVIAYGSRPSVGGQSQRIVFADHPDTDCIVHFHCPKKAASLVPSVSQREFECGSHECGKNTSRGLQQFGNLLAVYLDQHGPNVVFNKSTDPQEVIDFIEDNFDLTQKTGGYSVA